MLTDEPQPPDARLDAAIAGVMAHHGPHLPAGSEARLRESMRGLLTAVDALRAVPLTNADEPAPIFHAYRPDVP